MSDWYSRGDEYRSASLRDQRRRSRSPGYDSGSGRSPRRPSPSYDDYDRRRRLQEETQQDTYRARNDARDYKARRMEEQSRYQQMREAEQSREWVEKEDDFVLKQAKKRSAIRIKEGRGKAIDLLTVMLAIVERNGDAAADWEEEELGAGMEVQIREPGGVIEELGKKELEEMCEDVEQFRKLERSRSSAEYWNAIATLGRERLKVMSASSYDSSGRAIAPVQSDIDQLLSKKDYDALCTLELQIEKKLSSREPIDVDYWTALLKSLVVWKAKARLKRMYDKIADARIERLRIKESVEARRVEDELRKQIANLGELKAPEFVNAMDPEPALKIAYDDRNLPVLDEVDYRLNLLKSREAVKEARFIAKKLTAPPQHTESEPTAAPPSTKSSFATQLYNHEAAKGERDGEEPFNTDIALSSSSTPPWSSIHTPRKPLFFNRVQLGFEWNKYNQTHYDADNPPPKVVQGYKFNIFYPELLDMTKAPTYVIERNGKMRGTVEDDGMCVIRFKAGAPYEDVAFRIVDKDWDYSARRDRGFKSSFDKGVLQLHFHFKKVFYRK
ncbi:hypothetical protein YB2330_005898 [Saitoella coloradoensis]